MIAMKMVRTALMASALALVTGGAWADTLTLSKQNGTGASANPASKVVNYESPVASGRAFAGGFDMKDTGTDQTFGERFIAWCLDLTNTLKKGDYVVKKSTDSTVFNNRAASGDPTNQLSDTRKANINKLFNAVYDTSALDLSKATQSAAFQVALWEMAYEGADNLFNAQSGDFRITNAKDVGKQANKYLEAALSTDVSGRFNIFYLQASEPVKNQNLVTAQPIPLPAAGFLLIGGLGALTMMRRRKPASA